MEKKQMMLDELRNIYQIVKDQMIFAESKNGALLVFNMALMAVLLTNDMGSKELRMVVFLGLVVSCVISLFSFAPIKYESGKIRRIDNWNTSVIYFRNIASHNNDSFFMELCKHLGEKEEAFEGFSIVESYSQEIIVIARITVIKNRAFRRALYVCVTMLIMMAIGLCITVVGQYVL